MSFSQRRRRSDMSLNEPLLAEEDGSAETSQQPGELDGLVARFGRSLLNASPKDIPRLKTAVENDNTEEISEIMRVSNTDANPTNNPAEFSSIDMSQDSLFKIAVEECKIEWVQFFLDKITDKSIPFSVGATMLKESFNNLLLDYSFLVEDMIENDVLGWDVCTIEVPVETFSVESNLGSRVGTCNTILGWCEASRQGFGHRRWRYLNPEGVDKVLKKSRSRKVNANVRIFCFEGACQIGLGGIVRFLLLHKAPSSLFKSPLIKWMITFKWERVWKARALERLWSFLVLFVGFHGVAFLACSEDSVSPPLPLVGALHIFAIIALVLLLLRTLRSVYFQLKRRFHDGREVFPLNDFRGIRHYLGSRPNQIDLMLSGLISVMLVVMGFWAAADNYFTVQLKVLDTVLAIAVLLMWAKGSYLSQAFKKSGIFVVVMIGRVLQECTAYFLMLLGIMISFGFAMRIAFEDYEQHPESTLETETENMLNGTLETQSRVDYERILGGYSPKQRLVDKSNYEMHTKFGSLYRFILTMAYAIVGLFDTEILFECSFVPGLMIALFLIYLVFQTIIMFNMLIASMGDAFDGVRAAEEELLLMARANFIDQYEAAMSTTEIQMLQGEIGKYLYVLIPEDKQLEENVPFWKGRITTIKEDVTKIARDAQIQQNQKMNQMTQNMSEMFKSLKDDIKSMNEDIKGFNDNIKRVEDRLMNLEKRISDLESSQ